MAQVRILRYDRGGHTVLEEATCDPADTSEEGRDAVKAAEAFLQAHRDHGYTAVAVTPGHILEGTRVERITPETAGDIRLIPAIVGG